MRVLEDTETLEMGRPLFTRFSSNDEILAESLSELSHVGFIFGDIIIQGKTRTGDSGLVGLDFYGLGNTVQPKFDSIDYFFHYVTNSPVRYK